MIDLSIIIAARRDHFKLFKLFHNIVMQSENPSNIEVLVVIDDDDIELLKWTQHFIKTEKRFYLSIFIVKQSEHFTKDYWNFLAKKASGRWIIPLACDVKILTKGWDEIVIRKMGEHAATLKDDFILGLTRDNLRRDGEDALYPHFSCFPVISKMQVDKLGYFFDERDYAWGSDQNICSLYKVLEKLTGEKRIVSLVEVKIHATDSIHTTQETDEKKLESMRIADKSYQKFLRIQQEHPFTMTEKDMRIEARKIIALINQQRGQR